MGDEQNEVGRLMEIVTGDLKDHERRITVLEINDVKQDERIAVQQKTLDKIESNTVWILRLVVGALVTGVIGGAITLLFRLAFKA